MDNKTKMIFTATLLIAALTLSIFAYVLVTTPLYSRGRDPQINANVYIKIQRKSGFITYYEGHNVITDIGEDYVRDILSFDNVTAQNATHWISVSNDASPVQTWTQLAGEVAANNFTRALSTSAKWENGTDPAGNFTYTFTSSGSQQLQCAGLQWSGVSQSDNNLFAVDSFTQTTFGVGDTLTITWVITYDGN